MSEFVRPRHRAVIRALKALDGRFLERAQCYFGGGTRIVLALGEYRESADVDLLCSSREGYRALRSMVSGRSLGRIASARVGLVREVLADRYGIRTVLDIGGEPLKFEIILEGRIDLSGGRENGIPVPALDARSCFAEKFLANADRWNDESVLGRDIIDLSFMVARWGREPLHEGLALASAAYGRAARSSAHRAATKLLERPAWRRRCVAALGVSDTRTLVSGARVLVGRSW